MDTEKKKNILIAVLIIIIIALCVLIALIYTNKIHLKDKEIKHEDNNTPVVNDVTSGTIKDEDKKNSNWVDYLLSSHILEAKVSRFRSIDLGDTEDYDKQVTITLDDLKNIFSKLEDSTLVKNYSLGRGGVNSDGLSVSYERNDQKYEFSIRAGSIYIAIDDTELVNLFNSNNYEEKNAEVKDMEGSFYYYNIEDYSASMYDEYFD